MSDEFEWIDDFAPYTAKLCLLCGESNNECECGVIPPMPSDDELDENDKE